MFPIFLKTTSLLITFRKVQNQFNLQLRRNIEILQKYYGKSTENHCDKFMSYILSDDCKTFFEFK